MTQAIPEPPQPARASLALVSSAPARPAATASLGVPPQLAAALEALLQRNGSGLRLEPGSAPIGQGRGFLLRPPGGSGLQQLADAGVDIYPVQGLRGMVRGLSPTLGVTVIGLPDRAEGSLVARAMGLMSRALPADASILAVDQPAAELALSRSLPGAPVTQMQAADAMELLLRPPHVISVIITTNELARLFSAAAHAVSGTGDIAVALRARDGVVTCEYAAAAGAPADASGLALAAAWTLFCAGHFRAAASLHNALLRTLEDGLHTEIINLLLPYSREIEGLDMLQAVAERLGQLPQRIAPVDFSARPERHLQRVV